MGPRLHEATQPCSANDSHLILSHFEDKGTCFLISVPTGAAPEKALGFALQCGSVGRSLLQQHKHTLWQSFA
jgi:hypothetical protein